MRKFINRWRERQITKIEHRVAGLTELLMGLDYEMWPEDYEAADKLRTDLWMRRSALLKKLT